MVSWYNWNSTPAFEGLNPADYPHDDPTFWTHTDPMWADLLIRTEPKIVVEVGTYRGRTALYIADVIKKNNLDTKLICIDTWLGSPEHWRSNHDEYWQVKTKFGYPTLYYTFAANVVESGFQDIIIPLPTTSESGAFILKEAGIVPNIVFVDAAHEYAPCLRDFRAYWDILHPNGILVGDDYDASGWDDVKKAADEFALEVGRPLTGKVGKFVISKNGMNFKFREDGSLKMDWGW